MNSKKLNNLLGVFALTGVAAMFLLSTAPASAQGDDAPGLLRQRTLLDANWRFHRDDVTNAPTAISAARFDDHLWKPVHLPHDYVLDGTYSTNEARNHGYLPVSVAWYRRQFFIPNSAQGHVLRLDFDGAFRDSQVWVNGTLMGTHLSGYTPFSYDITAVARPGEDNFIAVRVDPRQPEGWWYEGGGIYRHVYFTELSQVHVAQWGTYVVATVPKGDEGADGEADLTIATTVENNDASEAACTVVSEIVAPDGRSLATLKTDGKVPVAGQWDVMQRTVISHPELWSLESPRLYELRTTILQKGRQVDFTTTTFGVRTIRYDADKGFFLNGRHVEIQGVANHQDLPALGIAVPDNLQAWRVTQLKQMGCDAWRTAHNPPNEALLDACDRLGMLVMDENRHLGDSYVHHSPKGTTATNLTDLATMIRRDRNHPSIIMWSMCNEETLQGTLAGAALFQAMMNVVHQYDVTRPITSAMNAGYLTNGDADVEDIVGVNYSVSKFDAIHERRPDKPMFGSEQTNQKTTRGEYADDRVAGHCSAYNLSAKDWQALVERPFMCGTFSWTGFDYRGEPNPFGWPDVSNNTGLLDLCGFPKDKGYYFESCWSATPMVHLVPDNWNWRGKEGQSMRVIAFSNAQKVELFLNDASLGVQDVPHDGFAEWQVPYAAGRLVAKGYTDGKTVATEELATTGPAARIKFGSAQTTLTANGEDAVIVPVSIVDAQGRVVPGAANEVAFQLVGGGRIVGTGNGDPADHDPERAYQGKAFHGRCVVIVQAGVEPGRLELTATSQGLEPVSAAVTVR